MLDTLALGCHLDDVRTGALVERGWTVGTTVSPQGFTCKLWLDTGLARLTFFAGIGWLMVEGSLPKIVHGDNAVVLDADECREGARAMWALAGDAARCDLPDLDKCLVSRFDPVAAWACDPAPYIGALVATRLPHTIPVNYGASVRWVTRSGRVRARCYDKAKEQGHGVGLPLRLERQVRGRKAETVRVEGKEIGRTVDEVLSPKVCRSVLAETLRIIGLDRPVRSVMASRRVLLDRFGSRSGLTAWAVLRDVLECGGVWSSDISEWRRRKYERMWADAGVRATSPIGELPALVLADFP